MIPNTKPMKFTPKGVVDAFDATEEFQGACQLLQNCIFDQSNPELVIPRPGVVTLADLATGAGNNLYTNASFISVQISVGTQVYGMVSVPAFGYYDAPFCYDTAIGSVIFISGITPNNLPANSPIVGAWVPPVMTVVGIYIVVAHAGFSGVGGNVVGFINISNPSAPAWLPSNTSGNALPGVPTSVSNFNNRAYYSIGNQLWYSDVLLPGKVTNFSQFLVIGDQTSIVAQSGLPISTTSSGVVAQLIVFKSSSVWAISGDTTTSNLAENYLSLTIGTNMPRSLAQAPTALYFGTSAGPYLIDLYGNLRPHASMPNQIEPDIQMAYRMASTPSRVAAAYTAATYRICIPTILQGTPQTVDYWFDELKRRWNGPHTFAYDCASAIGGSFILTSQLQGSQIIRSDVTAGGTTVYTDLGNPVQAQVLSSTFPKIGDMSMRQVAESQIELGGSGNTFTINAQDEQGNLIGSAQISVPQKGPKWGDGTLWTEAFPPEWGAVRTWGGGGTWTRGPFTNSQWGDGEAWGGGALWTPGANVPTQNWPQPLWTDGWPIPYTFPVPWAAPLVFEKMQLQILPPASTTFQIGAFYARYQRTGYMTLGQ